MVTSDRISRLLDCHWSLSSQSLQARPHTSALSAVLFGLLPLRDGNGFSLCHGLPVYASSYLKYYSFPRINSESHRSIIEFPAPHPFDSKLGERPSSLRGWEHFDYGVNCLL